LSLSENEESASHLIIPTKVGIQYLLHIQEHSGFQLSLE